MKDNNERISNAEAALSAWRVNTHPHSPHLEDEADARDLIADLLHLMHSKHKNIEVEVRMALNNFTEEANIRPYQITRI